MYGYGPFGNLLESDGTFDNAFMYTGQWFGDAFLMIKAAGCHAQRIR